MENFEQQASTDNSLLITNMMQLELAKLHGESIEDFISSHATDFRKIVTNHPEFIKQYEQNPEKTIQDIEEIIYH